MEASEHMRVFKPLRVHGGRPTNHAPIGMMAVEEHGVKKMVQNNREIETVNQIDAARNAGNSYAKTAELLSLFGHTNNHELTTWDNATMLPEDFAPIDASEVTAERGAGLSATQVHEAFVALDLAAP